MDFIIKTASGEFLQEHWWQRKSENDRDGSGRNVPGVRHVLFDNEFIVSDPAEISGRVWTSVCQLDGITVPSRAALAHY